MKSVSYSTKYHESRHISPFQINYFIFSAHLTAQQKTIVRDPRHNLELYGNYMPGLVAEIEKLYKDGKFNEMPLGPIGSFIEVNDSKYLKYVEEILGKFMKAFYVNDAKDGMLLSELFKKYPQTNQCPIITSRFINRVS